MSRKSGKRPSYASTTLTFRKNKKARLQSITFCTLSQQSCGEVSARCWFSCTCWRRPACWCYFLLDWRHVWRYYTVYYVRNNKTLQTECRIDSDSVSSGVEAVESISDQLALETTVREYWVKHVHNSMRAKRRDNQCLVSTWRWTSWMKKSVGLSRLTRRCFYQCHDFISFISV